MTFSNYNIVIFERISLGIAECIYLNQPCYFIIQKIYINKKSKQYNELLSLLKKANIFLMTKEI